MNAGTILRTRAKLPGQSYDRQVRHTKASQLSLSTFSLIPMVRRFYSSLPLLPVE